MTRIKVLFGSTIHKKHPHYYEYRNNEDVLPIKQRLFNEVDSSYYYCTHSGCLANTSLNTIIIYFNSPIISSIAFFSGCSSFSIIHHIWSASTSK